MLHGKRKVFGNGSDTKLPRRKQEKSPEEGIVPRGIIKVNITILSNLLPKFVHTIVIFNYSILVSLNFKNGTTSGCPVQQSGTVQADLLLLHVSRLEERDSIRREVLLEDSGDSGAMDNTSCAYLSPTRFRGLCKFLQGIK